MTHYDRIKETIIKQTDKHLPPSFNRYGCRVMCLLAIPQIVLGESISALGIQSILLHSLEDPDIVGDDWAAGVKEHWFINEGFKRLGSSRLGRQVGWTEEQVISTEWEYMIVHWKTDGPDGHFTLFDRRQEEIYDPHDPFQAGYKVNKKSILKRLVYRTWEVQ